MLRAFEKRSSVDFSRRLLGSVANLSTVGDFRSKFRRPTLVLTIIFSGVADPPRPADCDFTVPDDLAVDGHLPSSTIGVPGVRLLEADGVLDPTIR